MPLLVMWQNQLQTLAPVLPVQKPAGSLRSALSVQRTALTKSVTAPQNDSPAQPHASWAQVHAHAACAPVLRCDSQ